MSSIFGNVMRTIKGVMLKSMPGMITCVEFETFLIDYMEGDLPARQRTVFEVHLKVCRECREYLAAYRQTIAVSGRAFEDHSAPVPRDVPEDLVAAILAARKD